MSKHLLLLIIIGLFTSCKKFITTKLISDDRWKRETEYVTACRENWVYGNLQENVTVCILKLDLMANRDLSHPNFFIGSTFQGDTIGLIVYDFKGTMALGDTIEFLPGKSRNDTIDGWFSVYHHPLFAISHKRKRNALQCSVKQVYYAEIK